MIRLIACATGALMLSPHAIAMDRGDWAAAGAAAGQVAAGGFNQYQQKRQQQLASERERDRREVEIRRIEQESEMAREDAREELREKRQALQREQMMAHALEADRQRILAERQRRADEARRQADEARRQAEERRRTEEAAERTAALISGDTAPVDGMPIPGDGGMATDASLTDAAPSLLDQVLGQGAPGASTVPSSLLDQLSDAPSTNAGVHHEPDQTTHRLRFDDLLAP